MPFMSVDVHDGVFRPCCHNRHADWSRYATVEAYWNSQTLQQLRHNLMTGIKDTSCETCWNMEAQGHVSMRQSVTPDRRISAADRCQPRIKQVKLMTGNTCNLACMMCFRTVSSTYDKIWSAAPDWPTPAAKAATLQYDHAMEQYILQHLDQIEYIEVLGGEPLFSRRFMDLLAILVQEGAHEHITLFVITNGTLMTNGMINLLKQFKRTVLAVSVDGVGLVNEYQRWPSRWSEVDYNLSVINSEFDMSILPTVTALNLIHLPRLVDYCDERNYIINNFSIVRHWPQLLPSNLPAQLRPQVSRQYRSWLEGPECQQDLIEFVSRWDQQRNIFIGQYLPEWQHFFV
jgi:sulfatase maturation enzyme AslB (radical SAM superfamily)